MVWKCTWLGLPPLRLEIVVSQTRIETARMLSNSFKNAHLSHITAWTNPPDTKKRLIRDKTYHNTIKICSGEVSININHKWCKGPVIMHQEEQKSDQKQNSKSKQRIERSNCPGCCESAPTTTTQTMSLKQHYTEKRTIVKISSLWSQPNSVKSQDRLHSEPEAAGLLQHRCGRTSLI
jgi:hypothetical protein